MITTKEKIRVFSTDDPKIHLFKEGIFAKMYNESAYLFTKHLKSYKVNVDTLKSGEKYFYVGFPSELLSQNFTSHTLSEIEANRYWIATGDDFEFSPEEYLAWQLEVEQKQGEKALLARNRQQADGREDTTAVRSILKELSDFRLDAVTPMECMLFLSSVQKKIHGTISESPGI